jgi:hypothetical protein
MHNQNFNMDAEFTLHTLIIFIDALKHVTQ